MTFEPDGTATGSARSIASVDLGAVVREAVHQGLLIKGGGHAMAAGFALERRKQDAAPAFLREHLASPLRTPQLRQLPSTGRCRRAAPTCAHGSARSRRTLRPRPSRAALRLPGASLAPRPPDQGAACPLHAAAPDGARIEACAFRVADTALGELLLQGEGQPLHVAGHLRRTSWQGRESVELLIEDAADPRPRAAPSRAFLRAAANLSI